ncbi:BrnA antitoxin family protein [Hydrogenovibrio halophilus]|uniref:BrnA antitoxin family protein n=1 Tax=Hydrogenovibrio halophilus TaxID=373391 RepID=UPI0003757548|nr:BrnA antitoxin family protein [Hydrogenovibrio halophilus]
MRTVEERAQLDDYEIKDHYDFSEAVRGRFYHAKKVSTTLRLDNDVLLFLKKKANEEHIGYQTLINALLRDYFKQSTKV